MTTFEDGPAAGQTLSLSRSPRFLRVVADGGKFDALDQLHDEPKRSETIHVYVLVKYLGRMHVLRRGRCAVSGWYGIATYRHFADQPDSADTRTDSRWKAWTVLNAHKLPEVER